MSKSDKTFFCAVCFKEKDIQELAKAERNGKPVQACKECCYKEQRKQYFASM